MNIREQRRSFIKKSSTLAAGLMVAPGIIRAQENKPKLNIGLIGLSGKGASNLDGVLSENIVALCDVDENNAAKARSAHPKAKFFQDYRKLIDLKELDAIVVSTPDHVHPVQAIAVMQSGRPVYCEKPLAHSVLEVRKMVKIANEKGLVTQMGTQIHAGNNYRRVVELIQTNAIGPVREVHVWVGRAWGLQSQEDSKKNGDIVHVTERPKETSAIPTGLDWDLWVGPAPFRPFNTVYFPGPKWYRWWDFGNGTMSDLGSHWNDLPFWALKLKAPTSIEASGPKPHLEIAPASMQATYEFPARGDMPAVKMVWYQGANKPPHLIEGKIPAWNSGVLFVGDKGMLLSDYSKHALLPEKEFVDFKKPEPFIPKSIGHYAEWLLACKTGSPTTCNFEYSGWLTESNHLGNVAFRAGKKLVWDADKIKATNCPEADAMIKREYRKGWDLV